MPEIGDVIGGDDIVTGWGNAIRDRTVQRYANAAERDALVPAPVQGDLAFLKDSDTFTVFRAVTWRTLLNDSSVGWNMGTQDVVVADPGKFKGPGAVRHAIKISGSIVTPVGPSTTTDLIQLGSGFVTVSKMHVSILGSASNQQSQRVSFSYNSLTSSNIVVVAFAPSDMTVQGGAFFELSVVEYY